MLLLHLLATAFLFAPFLGFVWCCDCDDCTPPPYKLTKCGDETTVKYTNDDLSAYVGKVVIIAGSSNCWTVSCGSGGTPEAVLVNAVWSSCGSCFVPTLCDHCCSSPTGREFVVDLGAGGWTNGYCNQCTTVAGEYTLTTEGVGCDYIHTTNIGCSWSCPELPNCGGDGTLHFELQLVGPVGGRCTWRLTITLQAGSPDKGGCGDPGVDPNCHAEAIYETAADAPGIANCDETGPWTLTRTSDQVNLACGGTLPATIDVALAQ